MAGSITTIIKPKKLYRYRPLTDEHGASVNSKAQRELRAIQENYLWASSYKEMNDPMEGLYKGDSSFRENIDLYNHLFQSKQGIGIVSFSETPTNELMWAYYTNNMRGICIEYDVSRLLKSLNNGDQLIRMTYDEEMPQIGKSKQTDRLARIILARKNHRWSQEKEWRLLTNRMHRIDYHDPRCITQIIIGKQIDDEHIDHFRNLENTYDIKIIDVDGYKLRVRDFDEPLPFKVA